MKDHLALDKRHASMVVRKPLKLGEKNAEVKNA
jgi:hypothetical protein